MSQPVLQVDNLQAQFHTDDGLVKAVQDVSFRLHAGETLGIVGESGSGKSVTNLALLGLIPQPPGKIVAGTAMFEGRDLLAMTQSELARLRGNHIAMIFQDPMTSLNPFLTVAEQMTEVTRFHLGYSYREALDHAVMWLEKVSIPAAAERVNDYPHQFSGGMRQRVMIAMALSCNPQILIADEPTTALDVTIQAQILELLQELQREQGTSIILITHDLGVIAKLCHRVEVMYAGRIVEESEVEPLFANPLHPYTLGLLHSIPRLHDEAGKQLTPIPGQPPDMTRAPSGCAFHPRCRYAIEKCQDVVPPLYEAEAGHRHACLVQEETGLPQEEEADV